MSLAPHDGFVKQFWISTGISLHKALEFVRMPL